MHSNAADPKADNTLRVATVNINGIRAAHKRDMATWFAGRNIDIITLQEVRAPGDILEKLLGDIVGKEWETLYIHADECKDKGRAGVAIASRYKPLETRTGLADGINDSGRWVEADFTTPDGSKLSVASVYVHSGEVDTPRQDDKYEFLDAMVDYLPAMQDRNPHSVITGDLNVGHTELDIKNWKGNVKNSGFLPEERAYFDKFFSKDDLNWVDVGRTVAGEVPGPYTWWSYRGKAFDNDAGWRIDYHMATPPLADKVTKAVVDRAPSYDRRFSDHSPVVVDYQF
ncbi:MAG TPA: exodeoxyribonuclease III [Enteractinococcus helveticum]|uniref:Exodeoxyribonuclease III n=1 Tax=Enteractinococcus helveticum TaxID=1837282 RepID=A0A921FJL8_9MICC|nr:exodeoxyribonuclease III [Enteractinococcus helveticum]HJF13243.1 exodeoxyribonuclease III [Enteractinococcus helveticum]